jgi:trehalose 6-phosphate synthase
MTDKSKSDPLVVIVSNRGPFSFTKEVNENGDVSFKSTRGEGGLVTALAGLMQHYEVLWVAAALGEGDEAWAQANNDEAQEIGGTRLQLVRLDADAYNAYYNIIANPLLWFIHHQLWNIPFKPDIDKATWDAWEQGYVAVNRHMAQVVAKTIKDETRPVIVLPQDYHLYLLPKYLRQMVSPDVHIQPFIHIPWPGPDAWRMLPEAIRNTVMDSLLQSNRIGFQTKRDAFNFVQTGRFYLDDAHSLGSRDSLEYHGRKINATSYPISIDVEKLESMVDQSEVQLLKQHLLNQTSDNKIILRVDRIEPSKNILRGLTAFRALLEAHPEHQGKVQMLMLLVPSRMDVPEYQQYVQMLTAEAGLINAEYSNSLWEPVRIIMGNNYPRAIAAFQIYDLLLVNPIADGMNLVAKEGALINQRNGVLLLSEHAGAFYELGDHALIVNPFDIHNTAEAMHEALTMPAAERETRAQALREQVRSADIKVWFNTQMDDALRDMKTQAKKSSTPETPSAKKSAAPRTNGGVSDDKTPSAKV